MRLVSISITALLLATGARGEARDRLVVVQRDAGALKLVDPSAGEVDATIRVGVSPEYIALSPDGRTAIVSDQGAGRGSAKLLVVDLIQLRLLRSIRPEYEHPFNGQGRQLFGLMGEVCFPRDSRYALVTCAIESSLLVVDVEDGRVVDVVKVDGDGPDELVPSPDGQRVYLSNASSGTAEVLDARSRHTLGSVSTGSGARGIGLRPGTSELWVANSGSNSISLVDVESYREIAEVPAGASPARIAFSPDGRRAYCSNEDGGSVSVYDTTTRRVLHEVKLTPPRSSAPRPPDDERSGRSLRRRPRPGCGPVQLVFSPEGDRLFVSCTRSEYLAEIDPVRGEVRRYIHVGAGPRDMVWWRTDYDRASAK